MEAMEAQGFVRDPENVFQPPQGGSLLMRIPTELIPKCPDDGSDVTMNLRSDDSFVEDEGWHRASAAYSDFLRRHENLHVLYLEIGIGMNTPVFYSMRTKGKSTRNAIKRQISEGSHTWICCKSQDVKQMSKGIRADCAGSIVYFDSMIGLYEYTVLEGEQVPPPRAPPPITLSPRATAFGKRGFRPRLAKLPCGHARLALAGSALPYGRAFLITASSPFCTFPARRRISGRSAE